jgi:hypothetical protein
MIEKLIKKLIEIDLLELFYIDNPNDLLSIKSIYDLDFSYITDVKGDFGIYAIVDKKIVGSVFSTYSDKDGFCANRTITLSKNQCLLHHSYVNPDYRGKNIYPVMMIELCKEVFKKYNPNMIIGDIKINNGSAINGIAKTGFKHLSYLNIINICKFLTVKRVF